MAQQHVDSTTDQAHWVKQLALPALGVVFGDIGTSPLYTLRECINATGEMPVEATILGLLSLIFWSVFVVISLKYVLLIMRASNQGEGGIMALLALALPAEDSPGNRRNVLLTIGLIGAAAFYGDSVITPALSVLSAVEGLEISVPSLKDYVLHISITVLIGLFLIQRHGTAGIGKYFGPIILVWFLTLAWIGAIRVFEYPNVLQALNPLYGVHYLYQHGSQSLLVLGAVVLAVTGGEALYADMGHFGLKPIRACWFYLVFPALILNYFGQGATVLAHPEFASNPFFLMFPDWMQLAIVVLATLATIIASQAVISGTFSLTQQAFQLGYLPRVRVAQTSSFQKGQIYLPGPNYIMMFATALLILGFETSSNLASAYGIAVTITMLATSLLFYMLAHDVWRWNRILLSILVGSFIMLDAGFLLSNLIKVMAGGWLPLMLGAGILILMFTWIRGRMIVHKRLHPFELDLESFIDNAVKNNILRVPGTAIYLAAPHEGVPSGLMQNLKHYKALHTRTVIMSIVVTDRPTEQDPDRFKVFERSPGFYKLVAHFGFMEFPDMPYVLEFCHERGLLHYEREDTTYFVSRVFPVPTQLPGMAIWREKLFVWMLKNTAFVPDFFHIPADDLVELHMKIEI